MTFIRIFNHCTECMGEKRLFITRRYMKRSIITLYLILSEITQTTMDVVTALKMTFTSFKERGISKIQGNNASLITNQLEAFELSLNEVDSLLEEAKLYI